MAPLQPGRPKIITGPLAMMWRVKCSFYRGELGVLASVTTGDPVLLSLTPISSVAPLRVLLNPGVPVIHLPPFFSSHPTLSGKGSIRVRRLSTQGGHVPQRFEPLDDALAHACGENAP